MCICVYIQYTQYKYTIYTHNIISNKNTFALYIINIIFELWAVHHSRKNKYRQQPENKLTKVLAIKSIKTVKLVSADELEFKKSFWENSL